MKRCFLPNAACKIKVEIVLEVAVRNRARFNLRQIQPATGKAGKHAIEGAGGVRQSEIKLILSACGVILISREMAMKRVALFLLV